MGVMTISRVKTLYRMPQIKNADFGDHVIHKNCGHAIEIYDAFWRLLRIFRRPREGGKKLFGGYAKTNIRRRKIMQKLKLLI